MNTKYKNFYTTFADVKEGTVVEFDGSLFAIKVADEAAFNIKTNVIFIVSPTEKCIVHKHELVIIK